MSNTQLFSKMFGLGRQSRDIITLFHKPSSQASIRVHNMLKQTAAAASETATEDQASDHTAQDKLQRTEFDLEVVEAPPTSDQLKTMMEYAGGKNPASFITGATSITDALKRLKDGGDVFNRPVVVDWTNGRVIAGENESELVKMLRSSTPKEP